MSFFPWCWGVSFSVCVALIGVWRVVNRSLGALHPKPRWIYRFQARMERAASGTAERGRPSRPRPFRPLRRRSGRIPALPYPPLRWG